jgi:hypothetical protein
MLSAQHPKTDRHTTHTGQNEMNKSEQREVAKLQKAYDLGMDDMVARGISALIRCSMTSRSRSALMAKAREWEMTDHPEFIIHPHFA